MSPTIDARSGRAPGLEVEGLSYLDRSPVSLYLPVGEIHGLTGPSGSGKSILLRAIADLMPNQGRVSWRGHERRNMPAPTWRRQVGLLPASPAWWYDTVGEHFTEQATDWLSRLGFAQDVLEWDVSRMSSGEKQRLALVRLLGIQPQCLLLDEPMANLDAEAAQTVDDVIARFVGEPDTNRSALVVSHDPAWIARSCSHEWALRDGQLVEGG